MADELKARLSADISDFKPAMRDAASSVVTVKEASDALRSALGTLAEAEKAFGAAAAAGSDQAQAALEEYRQAVQRAQAQVDELAAAEQGETQILQRNISTRMAASAELKILEGNFVGSTRAAGALLASLPGLGEAMNFAFPVFGAVALISVMGQLGEKIDHVADEWRYLGDIGKATLKSLTDSDTELVKASEKDLATLRERRVIEAELSGGRKGRADRGAAAGAAFDINQEENNLAIAKANVEEMNEHMNELRRRAQPASVTDQFGNTQARDTLESRQAAEQLQQAANLQRANEAQVESIQKQITLEKEREQLRLREASEKETPKNTFITDAIRDQEIAERTATELHETLTRTWLEGQKQEEEATRMAARAEEERTAAYKRHHEEMLRMLNEEAQAKIRAAGQQYSATAHDADFAVKSGSMQPQERVRTLLAASSTEDDQKAGALYKEQSALSPQTNPQDKAKYQQLNDQIEQIYAQGAQKREQILQQEALREQQSWTSLSKTVEGSFNQTVDTWLKGTERMSRAWTQFGDSIGLAVTNGLLKAAEQQVAYMIQQQTFSADQRIDDAKTAAANSFAWASSWGGPVAGAIAASAAFAAVAAFDVGSDSVPRTGMALIHQNERIIPSAQNERITRALEGGAGNSRQGGTPTFTYAPQISTIDASGMSGAARRHGQTFLREASRMMRARGGQ